MKFHLYEDVVKVVHQILGRSNMFGYKTTMANQLYLWYCFMGKIYTAEEFHWHTKLLWLYSHSVCIAGLLTVLTLYVTYGIDEGILMLLYVLMVVFIVTFIDIAVPLLAFVYRHRIESAIELVDKIESKKSQTVDKVGNLFNMKTIAINSFLAFWLPSIMYALACHIDLALFYDENKPKNYIYYVLPLPKLEKYGCVEFYVAFHAILSISAVPGIFIVYYALLLQSATMAAACHNQVQRIVHQMTSINRASTTLESYQVTELSFKQTLVRCLHDYRCVTSVLQHFRGFYETLAGITLPMVLIVEIVHANLFLSSDYPYSVKLRELSVFFITLQPVFYFCWIGEIFEEIASTMSFAVYSTPWYWSTRMRKDVYLFLCEAQHSINATAWGVYPLLMCTFLRFMNTIQSSVNVLRAMTANR